MNKCSGRQHSSLDSLQVERFGFTHYQVTRFVRRCFFPLEGRSTHWGDYQVTRLHGAIHGWYSERQSVTLSGSMAAG